MSPIARTTWKHAPFIRLLPPLLLGIVTGYYNLLSTTAGWWLLVVPTGWLLLFTVLPIRHRFLLQYSTGAAFQLLLSGLGVLLIHHQQLPAQELRSITGGSAVLVTLEKPLAEKPKTYAAIARINSVRNATGVSAAHGKVMLYIARDSCSRQLIPGDQLLITTPLHTVQSTGNPGSLDYGRYCTLHHIYYQAFVPVSHWQIASRNNISWFSSFLWQTRLRVIHLLQTYIPAPDCGLAEALLIGYREDLDSSTRDAFARAGIVHIIAISGLHLGLIYWLLALLLRPLKRSTPGKWLYPVLIICGLWMFGLLAGGAPSVLRSAIMFSFIVTGQQLQRTSSVLNSLAASAFLLLCNDPFLLWDTGFQLSYAAVTGIIVFMKPIYRLLYFRMKPVDYIWQLLSVTLAAQVLTFPLVIAYFHQFPLLFPITNLVAVPMAGILLCGSLLLCLFSPLPLVAKPLGWCLSQLIRLLTGFTREVDQLPFVSWPHLQLNALQVACLYIVILLLAVAALQKSKSALWGGLCGLLVFTGLRAAYLSMANRQQQVVVYNAPGYQAIDFMSGRYFFYRGDSLPASGINRVLSPSRLYYRTHHSGGSARVSESPPFYRFQQKLIAIINTSADLNLLVDKTPVDLVIISHNPAISMAHLQASLDWRYLVLDGSNTPRNCRRWKEEAGRLHLPCFDVREQGAFVMTAN